MSYVVAGYIAKKLTERLRCKECYSCVVAEKKNDDDDVENIMDNFDEEPAHDGYFNKVNRGGLTAPSANFAQFVSRSFAVLDSYSHIISRHIQVPTKRAALYILQSVLSGYLIGCNVHNEKCDKLVFSTIANIFYNNKQKLVNGAGRKDEVRAFKQMKRQKENN